MNRTSRSLINTGVGSVAMVLEMIGQLVLRSMIVRLLVAGDLLYGVNQLFVNIISTLSIAELGVANVIGFSLYKPIAEHNQHDIIAMMQMFRKMYYKIAFIVLTLGVLFAPALPFFMRSVEDASSLGMKTIYLYYAVFVIDAFTSYFFSYNKTFLIADQRNYVVMAIRAVYAVGGMALCIGVLYLTRSFFWYLVTWTITRFLENATAYYYVYKKYPFLNTKEQYVLEPDQKKGIIKNIKALIFHRIGGLLTLNCDFLIYAGLGQAGAIVSIGVYSNFLMIKDGIYKFTVKVYDGIRASLGDYTVTHPKEDTEKMYKNIEMMSFIMFSFFSVIMLNISQPFVNLWMGEAQTASLAVLVVIILNFYMRGIRSPVDMLKDVCGIYWQDRYKSFVECAVKILSAIGLGILLADKFNGDGAYIGVLLGTVVSTTTVLLTVEPYMIYKYVFEKPVWSYYVRYVIYMILMILMGISSYFLCELVPSSIGLLSLIVVRIFICGGVCALFYLIFLSRTAEFQYLFHVGMSYLKKLRRKKANA